MKKSDKNETLKNTATAASAREIVSRFGDASAEYIKGYNGVDRQTGQVLNRGLKQISDYKVNPEFADKNIKQQAGFSAEVAKTGRDNAENIIKNDPVRTARSEDAGFGVNHPVYDHVELRDGMVIEGSGAQMKFVTAPDKLCDKIACGEGGGKSDLSRYRNAKIDLPSEQVEAAKAHCKESAQKLRNQSDRLEKEGKPELAARKRAQAKQYDALEGNLRDSGLTTQEAVFYRKHPKLGTARDVAKTGNRAGLEAAKGAAVLGGSISAVQNIMAVVQDDKELGEALKDTAADTAKAAGVAYATGFAGSATKSLMQQSASSTARTLSKTSLPSMVVVTCLEVGKSVQKYMQGDIDGIELAEELGEKGTGMLAGGMGAAVGQLAIPVPVVGAVIGSMIGYTISSIFYSEALSAFKGKKEAEANYERVKAACRIACAEMEVYRKEMSAVFAENLAASEQFFNRSLDLIEQASKSGNPDRFAACVNEFAEGIGRTFKYGTFAEFNEAMESDETIVI